ncbi:AAA family ATPase [Microbacterium lacus]|uniref:AAA family ATPase n=1 Tax=Microbacterium lacus TaxID=415217 RepID=A0ABN2H111_9MICO
MVSVALVAHVLITGMSGAGKSTVLAALARRGLRTVDTDFDGWVLDDGTWDEPRMSALLAAETTVIVSGTVENQGRFYDRFADIVLLTAPVEILMERATRRSDNPYGTSLRDQNEIRDYVRTVEPLLRETATLTLDGRRPVSELADIVEHLAAG